MTESTGIPKKHSVFASRQPKKPARYGRIRLVKLPVRPSPVRLCTGMTSGGMQRFQGGLVFDAHRLCVSLNSRLESNKEEEEVSNGWSKQGDSARATPISSSKTKDLIAASSYDKCSVGPSIRPICTRCCFTMTNMIQVCGNFH